MFSYSGEGIPLNIPPPASINKLNVQPNNMHAHMGHYMAPESAAGLHGALNMTSAMNPFNNFHNQRTPFPYSGLAPNMLRDAPNFMRESPHMMREPSNLSREALNVSRDGITAKNLSTNMSSSSNAMNHFNMFDERFRSDDMERFERGRSLLNIPQVNPRLPKPDDKMRTSEQNGAKYHSYEQNLPPYFDIKPDFNPEPHDLHAKHFSVFDQHKHSVKQFDNSEKSCKVADVARQDIKKFDKTDSDHNFVSKSDGHIHVTENGVDSIKVEQESTNHLRNTVISNGSTEVDDNSVVVQAELDSTRLTKQEESWTDIDYAKPFVKDVNGFTKDQYDLSPFTVIAATLSCSAALDAIKGQSSADNQSKVYECLHCPLLFRHPKRFLVHFKWHSYGQINEKRRQLNEEKEQRRLARRKIAEKPATSDEGTLSFPCDTCERAFSNRQKLITHRNKAHPGLPRACRACAATFPAEAELREHTRLAHTDNPHTDDANFMCDECPKTFKYMHSLLRHQPIHAEKKFGCKECEKKFGSELLLSIHAKTHAKVASYRCSYCGKGYYHAYNLSVHERGHRGERPYQCEVCRSTYATNSSLKRHMRVSHSNSKPFECAVCHRSFVSEQIRERHALRQHGAGAVPGAGGGAGGAARRRRRRRRADAPPDVPEPCRAPDK